MSNSASPCLPCAETLTVEFKTDRKHLPDDELVEALVCLANTEGGELWLGVEDDGTPTGLHEAHQNHRLSAVHVRLDDHGLTVSNPGGLMEGVTLHNLLTTEPRPRNRALADAMKRIGIVERSGRGVDTIYRGMLKFGRPAPDYGRTDAHNVVLQLPTVPADLAFRRMVVDVEGQRGAELPIDSLIALAALREFKRLSAEDLAEHIQRDAGYAKRTLEALNEAGLVEAHGNTRGRSYTLSASVYSVVSDKAAYTRQIGFTQVQHPEMVLNYVRQHGRIQRNEVMALCHLSESQAKALLQRMKDEARLEQHGVRRWAFYSLGEHERA